MLGLRLQELKCNRKCLCYQYRDQTWFLCPPNRRGGTYCFWCGSRRRRRLRRRPRCFVSVRYLLNDGRILTKLAQIHYWEGGTSWLDFGDLDSISKVTATFFNVWNFVCVRYLMNQWADLDQTCTDTMLGGCEELIRFWWPWPNFQGHSDLL